MELKLEHACLGMKLIRHPEHKTDWWIKECSANKKDPNGVFTVTLYGPVQGMHSIKLEGFSKFFSLHKFLIAPETIKSLDDFM